MAVLFSLLLPAYAYPALAEDEAFGPPNNAQNLPHAILDRSASDRVGKTIQPITQPISIGRRTLASRLKLTDRLVPARVYLPDG